MNTELIFFLKLLRNGFILTVLLFISMWATSEVDYALCKTVIVFFIGYIFTELAVRYKLKMPDEKRATLFFN